MVLFLPFSLNPRFVVGFIGGISGAAGILGVGGVHDLGEGVSGASLTFSTTQWGRCPAGQRGSLGTFTIAYRHQTIRTLNLTQ